MMNDARIFVAGHRGLVGSAIVRSLARSGYETILTRTRAELDLRDPSAVTRFFAEARPTHVFLAAARVGGIAANSAMPVEFLVDNLAIQQSVITAAYRAPVAKLLFLGSSCIYPRLAPQPIPESALLTGLLEPTNEAYAIAKIAGIKLCEAYNREYGTRFICAMPTNVYGPFDNFDLRTSHVLPALIRKFHEARLANAPHVVVWGTGTPRREFIYADDLGDACVFLMERYDGESIVNVGTTEDLTIAALADVVREITRFEGEVVFDATQPDGAPRKLLDVTLMTKLGWRARTALRVGLAETYEWYSRAVDLP